MSEQDRARGKLTEAVDTLKDTVEKLEDEVSDLKTVLHQGTGAARAIRAGVYLVFGAGGIKVIEKIVTVWGQGG